MICRLWRALTRPEEADNYVEHLRVKIFPQLRQLSGFIDASILKREVDRGAEFVVVTRWESLKGIEQFVGADFTMAVVPPEVQRMMIDYGRSVRHYEVVGRPYAAGCSRLYDRGPNSLRPSWNNGQPVIRTTIPDSASCGSRVKTRAAAPSRH